MTTRANGSAAIGIGVGMDDEETKDSQPEPDLSGRRRLVDALVQAPPPKLKHPRVAPAMPLPADKPCSPPGS